MNANPSSSWPEDLAKAFVERTAAFWEDDENKNEYENPDNIRECRIGHLEEELAYRKAEERGCCGSFEIEWDLVGVKVRYGFNYGH
jgi:hypothetical protein